MEPIVRVPHGVRRRGVAIGSAHLRGAWRHGAAGAPRSAQSKTVTNPSTTNPLRRFLTRRRMLGYALVALLAYAALVVLMYLFQDLLLFPGSRLWRGPVPRPPGVSVERLPLQRDGEAGVEVRVAIAPPPRGSGDVVLCFLGNGEDLRSGVEWCLVWRQYGLGAVVVEYPGYGESGGRPGVASFHAAGAAGFARAKALADEAGGRLFAFGNSIGSFVAVRVAAEQPDAFAGVVLRAPPGDLPAVSQALYPFVPAGLLLRHRFDAFPDAARVRVPVLVLHGDADRTVPLRFGRRLCDAFAGPKKLVVAEGYGHNDLPVEVGGPFADELAEFFAKPGLAVGGR
jgi:pimeloyl-ACP methyl ester carboxylesterase